MSQIIHLSIFQFGSVTNIKVGRSEKTGKSKGYAFVEFRFHEVAKTVAETMNNYLFFDKLLKCELVPQEKIRPSIFRNKINPKKPPLKKARALAKREVNKERDERQEQKRRRKQLQSMKKKAATLQALGVECSINFPSIEKEIAERKTRIKGNLIVLNFGRFPSNDRTIILNQSHIHILFSYFVIYRNWWENTYNGSRRFRSRYYIEDSAYGSKSKKQTYVCCNSAARVGQSFRSINF